MAEYLDESALYLQSRVLLLLWLVFLFVCLFTDTVRMSINTLTLP